MKELYVVSSHEKYEGNDAIGVFTDLSHIIVALKDYAVDCDEDSIFMIQKYEVGVIYDVPFLVGYFDKKGTQIYPYGVR